MFPQQQEGDGGTIAINERCRLRTAHGYRVASVSGLVLAHYAVGDRMGEAHAMVSLVDQGWATQTEVAAAFGHCERTVRRNQRRFESGGLAALGRPRGYPKGRPRLPVSRIESVEGWKAEGVPCREIARRLGVDEKAVRKLLRRLGWEPARATQMSLLLESAAADPKRSGSQGGADAPPASSPLEPGRSAAPSAPEAAQEAASTADPGLSGSAGGADAPPASSPLEPGRSAAPSAPEPAPEAASAADPELSGSAGGADAPPASSPLEPGRSAAPSAPEPAPEAASAADPELSGSMTNGSPLPLSLDTDAANRGFDRVLACMGLLDDAAPLFRPATQVPSAGVLLALPALVASGVFDIARETYGSIGPAFYGLRSTVVTLLLMALLRIKRPEGLKEHSPQALGQLLGLDRAPEVKTLRRKLARLAGCARAADFGHALAERRVATHGHAMGFLYVDGHVRAYHGKRIVPKTHVARIRLSMPATTDYWVNDTQGEPLFVVTTEANRGLVEVLPKVLDEVRSLVGERRVTVVFDRGGWSPALFSKLIAGGFDILTYRKGPWPRRPKSRFVVHEASFDGRKVSYLLADDNIALLHGSRPRRKRLRLRQVTRLDDNGHQTPIVTSRRDLSAVDVAYRMFERWRQENFFKYLREEYALDALVDYEVEPADAARQVPNPKRKELDAQIRKAYAELQQVAAHYGAEAFVNPEALRRALRSSKNANDPFVQRIRDGLEQVAALESKRAVVPARVPVQQVTPGEIIKLSVERKHLTDLLKMVAYQAEGDLFRLITPHYRRAEDEGRTLVQTALEAAGDIEVTATELRVSLHPLSSPHRTQVLVALCEHLSQTKTRFPGSNLRLTFDVKPSPETSLAFPGPRAQRPESAPQPDISAGG